VLSKEDPSPLAPESDEEKGENAKKETAKPGRLAVSGESKERADAAR